LYYVKHYAPMARFDSIWTTLSIIVVKDIHMVHFDTKTLFLYGDISKELYMQQAKGFENS
jgi:hypothetical protein